MKSKIQKIRELNDLLRDTRITGKICLSDSLKASFTREQVEEILQLVNTYDNFTPDNDPHEEHDFGQFDYRDVKIFWKIDYYDKNLEYGSEAPENPHKTTRVLTVMLAQDY